MAGVAGAAIGVAEVVPAIGGYVQDALAPCADTNYIGVNTAVAYKSNVLGEDFATGFTCPSNEEAATGGVAVWVESASVLIPTDKVAIVDGVATKDNSTGTHTVFCNAEVGDYLWVVDVA